MENWKEVKDGETQHRKYFISDLGRIKVINGTTEIIKIGYKQANGYLGVTFGAKDQRSVHVLVAEYFCDKPEGSECVNHINGIKTDNRAVNLEWCTYAHNNRHAYDIGLNTCYSENHHGSIDKGTVYRIYNLKKEGKRLYQISKLMPDVNYGTLKNIFKGKNWKYEYEKIFGEVFKKSGLGGSVCWNANPKEKVLDIYRLKKEGKRIFEIAKEVDLKFHTVKDIYHGKNWKHLYKEHFS